MRFSSTLQVRALLLPPIAATLILLAFNGAFWQRLAVAAGGWQGIGTIVACFFVLALALTSLFSLLNFPYVLKPLLVVLLIGSSLAAYFMNRYGIQIDRTMIQNVIETDAREATELLHWKLFGYLLCLGVIPGLLIWRLQLRYGKWGRHTLMTIGIAAATMAVAIVVLLAFYKSLAPTFRGHRELRFLLTPTNYVQALNSYVAQRMAQPVVIAPLGRDAARGAAWQTSKRRSVTVIVVGETARAMNFSLNGYARETNPLLAKQSGLINFTNVSSCGTATAVSLPCVFSAWGREQYTDARGRSQEGLLDVLRRAGLEVVWIDNNSGCKGACDRVEFEDVSAPAAGEKYCNSVECFDERLLESLSRRIDQSEKDMVIVLHQKGSHGPAYSKRYPAAFEKFSPVCQTNELELCSREEIVAAYDNTIAYTDFILSQVIAQLDERSRRDGIDTSMLYFSDHGESLGEKNLYLHGAPYLIAPKEQKHVPMMLWLSSGFADRFGFDVRCVGARSAQPISHDNVFHSILGMLDINTAVHNPALDIFHACSHKI